MSLKTLATVWFIVSPVTVFSVNRRLTVVDYFEGDDMRRYIRKSGDYFGLSSSQRQQGLDSFSYSLVLGVHFRRNPQESYNGNGPFGFLETKISLSSSERVEDEIGLLYPTGNCSGSAQEQEL
jgi:hypothetical protein